MLGNLSLYLVVQLCSVFHPIVEVDQVYRKHSNISSYDKMVTLFIAQPSIIMLEYGIYTAAITMDYFL